MNFGEIWNDFIEPAGEFVGGFVPYVGPAIKAINAFMPDDEKLGENATKDEMKAAVESLPADQRGALMGKQIDLEIVKEKEWSHVVDSLAKADSTGNTTRPEIAKLMSYAVFATVIVFLVGFIYAVMSSDDEILTKISESWEVMLAVLATPTALLRAYFGLRTDEKKARYAAAGGKDHSSGVIGVLGAIFKNR